MSASADSLFVLRGRRTKGLRCRPFVNSRNQRKCPLDSSRSGDSALRPRTDSGLPAFTSFGRDKVLCKSVQIVRSVGIAVTILL